MPKTNMAVLLLYYAFAAIVLEGLLLQSVSGENHMCASACSCLLNLVDCSKLGLIEVPPDLPVFVTRLELQFNGISSISAEDFRGLNNLTHLDLSNNEIRTLDESVFTHLPALSILRINQNKLTEVPQLQGLTSLTSLELNQNRIHTLATEFTIHMPQLKVLGLSHNQILDIVPGVFPVNNSLQKLTLNGNGLETFEPGCFDNLTSLEVLKMNKNRIRVLPKNLFSKMERLKNLEITKNQLRQIEGLLFHKLANLQVLKLQKNQISVLMDGAFWGLTKIQKLHLDYNNITSVTQSWLYRLESLQQLSLTNNRIDTIDAESLEICKVLQKLDLSNNRLTSITQGSFSKLYNLQALYLNDNLISNIDDGAFRDLSQLQLLELNNNAISWTIEDINGAFTGLVALTKLGLENNKIKSIAKNAFDGLSMVQVLNLQNNAITSIQRDALESMTELSRLSFNSSSLLCDCQLAWLPQWLIERGFQSSVTAVCAHPVKLRGRNIYTISPQEFKCEGDFLQPVITASPISQIALKGENITLNCSAASTVQSHTTFSWKKDNILLTDPVVENFVRADGDIVNYTSYLHLTRIRDRDAGRYQCIISNEFGSAYSYKADMGVHVFPKFVKTPVDVTVKAGNTARLQCAATGQPFPTIAWKKDGGDDFPAARERRVHVMTADDVFFIVEVNIRDEGVYSCTAKNDAGMISANATLRVLESPTFVKPMENVKVTSVGDTAVLECMAAGSPAPNLTWLKNDQPLKESQRYFFTAGNQLLIIVQTERSDQGRYTCVMSNTLGKETGYTILKVTSKHRGVVPDKSSSANQGPSDESTTTGIIIIAVVCCVVGTSLVWVIIIYQTRKRHEMYSATPTDETTLPGEMPSSGYTSSDKEGSFTQPVQMTAPNFQYQDYQMKESGYESSSGRFRAARAAAIFPSDVDEEEHQQSVPLTLGEHQLGSDSPENSVSSLHYPNSDETDSMKSSHSTNSTRASDHHTLRTFHPLPTNHDTTSVCTPDTGGGYCEGCEQCQVTTGSGRQHSANYRHSYNSPQHNGMPIHHGSQPQPPGTRDTPVVEYQVEDSVCDSPHNISCNCRCGVTSPVHNSPAQVPSNSTVCHHLMKSPSPSPPHTAPGVPPHVVPNIPNPYLHCHHSPSLLNTHDCHMCAKGKPSACSVSTDSSHHNNYRELVVVGSTHRKSNSAVDKIPPVIPPKHKHSLSHSKANGAVPNGTLNSSDGKTVDV